MKQIIKNSLILMAITLAAGLALGFVHDITKEPIAAQELKTKEEAYKTVFADAVSFEAVEDFSKEEAGNILSDAGFDAQSINEVLLARDGSEKTLGAVMNVVTSEGYGGDIEFAMGILNDGTVNGIKILSISETAGLGMRATEEEFYGQFALRNVDSFVYTKNGAQADNEIDAISGATVTTNAMTNGVNAGIAYFRKSLEEGGIISE